LLKKILIGFLIFLVIAFSVAFAVYKKVEAQFEGFVMSELQRREEEVLKELQVSPVENIENENNILDKKEVVAEEISNEANTGEIDDKKDSETTREDNSNSADNENEVVAETQEEAEVDVAAEEGNESDGNGENGNSGANTEETANAEDTVKLEETEVLEEARSEDYSESFESDKTKAMGLALQKLSIEQIARLINMSKEGFTPEERAEAKEMFYGNFTEEEQEWVLEIYSKHYLKN